MARGHRWPRPREAIYLSEKWPDGVAPYAFGSRFIDYLAGAAGDSSVPRFIEKTAGQWIPFRTGRPLRLATGLDRDSLWQVLGSEYEHQAQGRPPSSAEVLASGLRVPPSPAVAEDGTVAWLESSLSDVPAIVVRRPNGATNRYRTTAGVDLAWNGDTLFATWLEIPSPGIYRSDLHRLANGGWESLTRGERLTDISAGNDGVVAVQVSETGNRLVRYSKGRVERIPGIPSPATYASPAVDSGERLVAIEQTGGAYRLRGFPPMEDSILHQAGTNEVLADLTWDPQGFQLYVVSDRSGLPQVYRLAPGGPLEQVTDEPVGARQPALAPEGWIYFTTLEADGYALKRSRMAALPDQRADSLSGPPVAGRGSNRQEVPSRIRQSAYSPWPALRPHYFIPYFVTKGSAGSFLGGFTSGSDPVGRFSYALRGAGGIDGGKVDASISLAYRRWDHHSFDLYLAQDNGDAGIVAVPETLAVQSRERDAELGFTTTWRRWYRSLTLRLAADYEEDRFASDPPLDFINPRFGAASAGLSWSRTLRPPLAISDEDGAAVSLRYRRRWRLDRDGGSDEWRTRLALYRSIKGIGGFAHPVLAARISAATSSGKDRETFGAGGASGLTYQPLPGIVVGSSRAFPVRGFEPGEIRGGTVAVGAVELRLPLALVAEPLWDLPYGLDRISLRIFYDYGRVWDPPVSGLPRWIHGAGVEVTWDLLVLYGVPLRLRTGVAAALNDGSVTRRGDLRFGLGFGSEF
jgi:hypothetical protein